MKRKKIITWLIIVVVVLIIFLIIGKKAGWFGQEKPIEVTAEKVKKRTIVEIVSASGKVEPVVEVKISPDVSGEIVELPVKEGAQVEKGTLLTKIKPETYIAMAERMEAGLNSTKANYEQAKAQLTQVKAKFENDSLVYARKVKLWEEDVISKEEFEATDALYKGSKANLDAAMQTVKSAEYAVKSAEASLKEANDNLVKTSIFAPVSGTISMLSVEKGERVVGTSAFAGTEIMRIANMGEMEVNVEVNENDIIRVHLADTADIEVDAYMDRKFKGIVTEISSSAKTTGVAADQVTNFSVKIRILQESYQDLLPPSEDSFHLSPFRPGMSATVDIKTKTVQNVLSVPIQAVTTRDDTIGKKVFSYKEEFNEENKDELTNTKSAQEPFECVFEYRNDIAKLIKVKTGIQDQNYIEILEGLNEEQEIITAPYNAISKKLMNDSKVKKVEPREIIKEIR